MKVIGLDLSLTSTGVSDGRWVDTIRPPTGLRGPARHAFLLDQIGIHVDSADLVVVEGAAYGHNAQSGHEELAGLRQMVNLWLWRRDIPYALIPPTVRAKYATGKGNASKEEVATEVQWRYGVTLDARKSHRYDEADALVLANMGWHWLGSPLMHPPEGFSLAGKWPEEAVAEPLREAAARALNSYRYAE